MLPVRLQGGDLFRDGGMPCSLSEEQQARVDAALQRALAEVQSGVILIPAGVYVLSNIIDHRKPIVLRGEGTDKTILYFTNSLTDIKGNSWRNGVSDYAHSDALINIRG